MSVAIGPTGDLATCPALRHAVFVVEQGVSRAELGAQSHAPGFYEGLGFVARGPVYDDAGMSYRDMERAL